MQKPIRMAAAGPSCTRSGSQRRPICGTPYTSARVAATYRTNWRKDRKSTRLNSSHTVISPLSLHDALPISNAREAFSGRPPAPQNLEEGEVAPVDAEADKNGGGRTELYQERQPAATDLRHAVYEREGGGDVQDELEKRSEEHTSELQSHSDLPSFPTRRSSDLECPRGVFRASARSTESRRRRSSPSRCRSR